MGMEPGEFFEAFVEGNLTDLEEDPSNVRRAFNAAVAAFHMADHFYAYYSQYGRYRICDYPTRDKFLIALGKCCPEFIDIQSVANVYKHLYSDTTKSHVMIGSAGAIDTIGDGHTTLERDRASATQDLDVVYQIKSGEKRPLLPTLKNVASMWREVLNDG